MSRARAARKSRGGGGEVTCQDVGAVHPGPAGTVCAAILILLAIRPCVPNHACAGKNQELFATAYTKVATAAVLKIPYQTWLVNTTLSVHRFTKNTHCKTNCYNYVFILQKSLFIIIHYACGILTYLTSTQFYFWCPQRLSLSVGNCNLYSSRI